MQSQMYPLPGAAPYFSGIPARTGYQYPPFFLPPTAAYPNLAQAGQFPYPVVPGPLGWVPQYPVSNPIPGSYPLQQALPNIPYTIPAPLSSSSAFSNTPSSGSYYDVTFPNGDHFAGFGVKDFNQFFPHGQGTKSFRNGDSYVGGFCMGEFDGFGTYKSKNGDWYQGHYSKNLRHGHGTSYNVAQARKYDGYHVLGNEDGYARILRRDYAIKGGEKEYVGYVKNGLRHGSGKQTVTGYDGRVTVFEGQWVNDVLHGAGTMSNDNRQYWGTFYWGNLEGDGICKYAGNNTTYRAVFRKGMIERMEKM